jgi:hypothetical protein
MNTRYIILINFESARHCTPSMFLFLSVCLGKFQICQYFSRENSTDVNNVTTQVSTSTIDQ